MTEATEKAEKTYQGVAGDNNNIQVYPENGEPYQLHRVVYHSLTPEKHGDFAGFAWGYGGSGPADLALSILADHLGEHPDDHAPWRGNLQCWRYYQPFKWDFVANWSATGFVLHSEDIDAWLGAAMLAKRCQEEDGWLDAAYEDANGCGLDEN